jgi:Family of unknown function (DUF5519)
MPQPSLHGAWTAAASPAWDPATVVAALTTLLSATLLTTIAVPLLRAVLADYHAFLSLGPGGTPSTPAGYLRIKFLGLFALKDPLAPLPDLLPAASESAGRLAKAGTLPTRRGVRPQVRGIAPHRQTDQHAPRGAFASLAAAMEAMAARRPARLVLGTSCLEGHGPGLFARAAAAADNCSKPRDAPAPGPLSALVAARLPGAVARQGARATPRCPTEVVHAHPSDGSLHLTLHPADAAAVIRAGWGERHPLGSGGWLSWFVPAGFILVYAPRDEAEVRVTMRIVAAAVWWVGGFAVEDGEEDVQA